MPMKKKDPNSPPRQRRIRSGTLTRSVCYSIPSDLLDRVNAKAASEGRTRSNYATHLMRADLGEVRR